MRRQLILLLQKFLRQRYNKQIVEIHSPFRDMVRLLHGKKITLIVDGGAYHGVIAQELCSVFPGADVYAFEPYSVSFEKLRVAVRDCPQIHPVHCALSSHEEIKTLYVNAQDSTNALSPVAEMGKKYQSWQTENIQSETVKVTTLDLWAENNTAASVDILKLDLQGYELEALHGAERLLRNSVKLIYTEVEFVRLYEQNCLYYEMEAYLHRLGFRLYQLYNLSSGDDNQLVCADAIFIHPGRI